MKKIRRVVHSTAPEAIRDRVDFKNSTGNLRGENVDGMSPYDHGWMDGDDLKRFREDCRLIRYVVYSFATPIAWWAGEAQGWYVVKQRFSPITSTKHQSRLYLIPSGFTEVDAALEDPLAEARDQLRRRNHPL